MSTCMPHAVSWSFRIIRFVWLSSTTRTRRPASSSAAGGGTGAGSTASSSGTSAQNVLPSPGVLVTPSSPPIAFTS